MTKKDLVSGKYYWAKKLAATAFKFIIKIEGTAPFMYVGKCANVIPNGDTPFTPNIDQFADEFYDANFPTV